MTAKRIQLDLVEMARDAVANHEIPGKPAVPALTRLRDAEGLPFRAGPRVVTDVKITDPSQHSEGYNGGPYLSAYHVITPHDCGECGYDRADYRHAQHEDTERWVSLTCARCGYVHREEEIEGRERVADHRFTGWR